MGFSQWIPVLVALQFFIGIIIFYLIKNILNDNINKEKEGEGKERKGKGR
ncbi:hypothetical protein PIROE2DRAFT_19108 [Piromyces sp. E2]|nr:hypothetical protein PIROE2DRAFT_19108 [Piromyces sp. E2]|eukprot:OUM56328.1 hypothetical protein PIROE2DRAFT_19108 [Piromyces sp. E2]